MNRPTLPEQTMSAVKLALLARQVRQTVQGVDLLDSEPIAIVGMGCRFPGGAGTPARFWELLARGGDAIAEVPPGRWDAGAWYHADPAAPGRTSSRWGGFLDDVAGFDPGFFGISHEEACYMDPQQRLLLEVAWEALEHAGLPAPSLAGSDTGVFVGCGVVEYTARVFDPPAVIGAHSGAGTMPCIVANRLSYFLDLHGPSLMLDTACSSSLVAVHLACRSLRNRDSRLAIAGGVMVRLDPKGTVSLTKAGLLSPDGRCMSFDARANGFVRSEGCGVVVLKRLSDALADQDRVLAIVRGSAANQDGASNGMASPNLLAQQDLIRQALHNARVAPDDVSYVEAHGAGTALGDAIEVEALRQVYGTPGRPPGSCVLGAVKSNLGHLEAAAGIAGLIKAVLCLHGQAIPANLHTQEINPNIPIERTPFALPRALQPWPAGARRRFAAVSSFGLGGTNAHVILEEAPQPAPGAAGASAQAAPAESAGTATSGEDRVHVLPLSARSPASLRALARAWLPLLADQPAAPDGPDPADVPALGDIAYTAGVRRTHHDHRLAVVGRTREALREQLEGFLADEPRRGLSAGKVDPVRQPRVAFVFPGQGSQWVGMGRELMAASPVFREAIAACEAAMRPFVDWSLAQVLLREAELERVDVIQPTLFAMQVALAAVWRSWGVAPDAVVGHSMGEVAAAHVAGALRLEDAARVICQRSRLVRERGRKDGAMAVVELSAAEAERELAARGSAVAQAVSVAVSNSPRMTVLSGDRAALEDIVAALEARGLFCRFVRVDFASHSPHVEPLGPALRDLLAGVAPRAGTVPIYSAVTGQVTRGAGYDAAYWVDNLRRPVQFADTVVRLEEDGHQLFVEISPHPILTMEVESCLAHAGAAGGHAALPSLRRDEGELETMLGSLGGLYAAGLAVDWRRQSPRGRLVDLPAYPWDHRRCWVDPPAQAADGAHGTWAPRATRARDAAGAHPLLGHAIDIAGGPGRGLAGGGLRVWETEVAAGSPAYLDDHRIAGAVVVPATLYVEMALAAGAAALGVDVVVEDMRFPEALRMAADSNAGGDGGDGGAWVLQTQVRTEAGGAARIEIYSRALDDGAGAPANSRAGNGAGERDWILRAGGALRAATSAIAAAAPATPVDLSAVQARCPEAMPGHGFYSGLEALGFEHGPRFRGIERLVAGPGEALGRIALPAELARALDGGGMHPALLDIGLQVLGVIAPAPAGAASSLYLPEVIERLAVHGRAGDIRWSHAVLRADGARSAGDVRLLGEHGQVIAEVRGLGFAPAPAAWLRARGGARSSPVRAQLAAAAVEDRRALLEAHVRDEIARVLQRDPRALGTRTPFNSMGLDSKGALALRNRLQDSLGVHLAATLVWGYPTIADLAPHLAEAMAIALEPGAGAGPDGASGGKGRAVLERALDRVDRLSEEDALQALLGDQE